MTFKKEKMQKVKNGDTVKVHYHGKLTTGETFDSSEAREPLSVEVGVGMVIKGFDDGLLGMAIGEKKTIHIPVADAYGEKDQHMIIDFERSNFPDDMTPVVGMPLTMNNNVGQQFNVTIVEVKEDVVLLDANHPLAGQDLIFDLELVEIEGGSPMIIMP